MACNNQKNNSSTHSEASSNEEPTMVGDEKDNHGCLIAAGETWSELKQDCIRVFEVAQRLNPVEVTDNEAIISAFALFNDDQSKVELFLPESESVTILEQSEGHVYKNDTYSFDAENSTLYVNGEKKFDGNL